MKRKACSDCKKEDCPYLVESHDGFEEDFVVVFECSAGFDDCPLEQGDMTREEYEKQVRQDWINSCSLQ